MFLVSGCRARDWKIRTWALVRGTPVYLVRVEGKGDAATGDDAKRFYESFKISDQ
ncbi:hypothetical protein [Frigoriglobus tundricola]|uniref:Uncharacterized protein n=1 Tax=Frigoriglobus tundricola TaxID=2774151 RepID=A0A6M5YWU7_9BACT|nr:hypothetical protein [Frigoriglobus tundricola]QJW98577.1 hypothetical protein FTUN_6172 [Frigoriglobus tundricola]